MISVLDDIEILIAEWLAESDEHPSGDCSECSEESVVQPWKER